MKVVARLILLLVFANAWAAGAGNAESQIRKQLNDQVEAWNRGDVPAFVATYASDCTFVGKQVARGRAQLLARYRKAYPTRDAMGHLSFNGLEIHLLTADVALVTGGWHIDRASSAGSDVGGLFSLVFRRQHKAWKIALDHTS